jgi:hypothetical protein
MNYYGYSIWHNILNGDPAWCQAYGLPPIHRSAFEEYPSPWETIFQDLGKILQNIGIDRGSKDTGGCLHFSSNIPQFLTDPTIQAKDPFLKAKQRFQEHYLWDCGMHSTFGKGDHVNEGRFATILASDLRAAAFLGATHIVEHFPQKGLVNVPNIIEELTSTPILQLLHTFEINLAWENHGRNHPACSLRFLVEFRNQLCEKLHSIHEEKLIPRFQFCFDTGHLLLWRNRGLFRQHKADQEIATYLPQIAEHCSVFHIHANDGARDYHIAPRSTKYLDNSARSHMNKRKFLVNSAQVIAWLKICAQVQGPKHRHIHMELLRPPFDLEQIESNLVELYQIFH